MEAEAWGQRRWTRGERKPSEKALKVDTEVVDAGLGYRTVGALGESMKVLGITGSDDWELCIGGEITGFGSATLLKRVWTEELGAMGV